ncbi:unnamed protein product, partial [Ectocarpus sp. 12 AP-2014]
GRSFALRRPSRVSLDEIRVGDDVLINGTRVHVYDADGFTRRSIPGLGPPESPPVPDKTFSVTPRRGPLLTPENSTAMSGSCRSPGCRTGSTMSTEAWPSWDCASGSVVSQDPPGIL